MCLPCWPWTDIYLEERIVKKKDPGVLAWDPNARSMVRVTGVNSVSSDSFHSLSLIGFPCRPKSNKGIFICRLGFTFRCSRAYKRQFFLKRIPFSNTLYSQSDRLNHHIDFLLQLDIRFGQQTNLSRCFSLQLQLLRFLK